MFDISKQPRLIYQGCCTTWGVLARTQLTADGSCKTESRYIAGKKEDLVKYLKVLYDAKFSSFVFLMGITVSLLSANSPQSYKFAPIFLSPLCDVTKSGESSLIPPLLRFVIVLLLEDTTKHRLLQEEGCLIYYTLFLLNFALIKVFPRSQRRRSKLNKLMFGLFPESLSCTLILTSRFI